jgi:hypothetical protein
MSSVTDEMLPKVFEQNWEHARHVEIQRLNFTSIYGAIVAGTLALGLREDTSLVQRIMLLFVLLIISIFGFFMTLKWNSEFRNHIKKIDLMVSDPRINLKHYMGLPLSIKPKVRWIFSLFYATLGALWYGSVFWYSAMRMNLSVTWLTAFGIVLEVIFLSVLFLIALTYNKSVERMLDP